MNWLSMIILLFVAMPALGAVYQLLGLIADRHRYPPTGKMVEAGGQRLHLKVSGASGPVVVLEAGIAATSLSWSLVEPQVAHFARAVSYDRDGLGWSDSSGMPAEASRLVAQLYGALKNAGLAGPHILVGHSFGGMLAVLAACLHPERVMGLVLVDPLTPGEWKNPSPQQRAVLRRAVNLSRRGALLARFGVVRLGLDLLMLRLRRLPLLISRVSSGKGVSTPNRIVGEVRKLPREVWPMVKAHWTRPKSFVAMANHLAALPENSAQTAAAIRPLTIPVVVISAGDTDPVRMEGHRDLLKLSPDSEHIVASECAHWVHLDEPELVVNAIRRIVEAG